MKVNLVNVDVEVKSHLAEKAIESLLDDNVLHDELVKRVISTVRGFIEETGVMGTRPYDILASENSVSKNIRSKVQLARSSLRQ